MICRRLAIFLLTLACAMVSRSPASDIPPSPYDDAHLVVIHPGDWSDTGGASVKTKAIAVPALDQQAIAIGEPLIRHISVRFAGSYVLWIRLGQTGGKPTPVHVEIMQGDVMVLQGDCNADEGREQLGGPAGYRGYREKASQNKSHDALGDPELTERHGLPSPNSEQPDKVVEGLSDDLLNDVRAGTGERWMNTSRVEKVAPELPFYWWKIGQAALKKGEYEIRVRTAGPLDAAACPLVNAAILTTCRNLIYPYLGDLDAPRASYIRFRLDKLPADGLEISADINNHTGPYYRTPPFFMNPSGLSMKKSQPHTATGFSRWYCLQDVERAPGLNGNEVTLHLMNPAAVAASGARGATQFAVFPTPDRVVRTIGWDEPDGLIISMQPDFENNQHLLRTIRDHAEEHYEAALAASGGAPHPLVRGEVLSFSNSWGAALGDDYDYLVKTMRLLGFNSMGIRDPLKSRTNYGGYTSLGTSWELSALPFDEPKTRKIYDDYYRNYFKNFDQETLKGVNVFQISDEPSETAKEQMTAPLWRFEHDDSGRGADQWFDRSGDSDLNTRKTDLKDCVLEGTITKMSGWVGFRVGIDRADAPTRYAYWRVGTVAPNNMPENLAVGKVGLPGAGAQPTYILRPSAAIGSGPTPFKIIYEGARAAFYLNEHLVHEHTGLPATGGFGIIGAPKSIGRLLIRPIAKGEHMTADFQNGGELLGQEKAPAVELDDPDKAPTAVPKPLKQFVDEDWIQAGGIPEARVGFRQWLAARGMSPQFFGETSWDSVRMLTVRELVRNENEAKLYYWSRRYSGYLTPRMFALAADAVRANSPNKQMLSFVGLSGHSLYFPSQMPLDMFEMGNQGNPLMPGISDWMFYGGWRWDSFQVVAYSVAPYNAGARRWGPDGRPATPASFPMMHCVSPNVLRAYTMLANQVKYISYFAYGPYYAVPADFWSESQECYEATSLTDNRAAGVDDVLSTAQMRPSRVALLYSLSTEYWDPQSSFADRRSAFLALSHEYYQPELITEDQINSGELQHYDALYVMDPNVAAAVQDQIGKWVQAGGLLWASADALVRNEYNQPLDGLASLAGLRRTFAPSSVAAPPRDKPALTIAPVKGEADFRPHAIVASGMPEAVIEDGARVRARYDNGAAAWLEKSVGKGKLIYLAHRAGLTYSTKASRPRGYPDIWAETGRAPLTLPLIEAKVDRELICSEPAIMASPLSTTDGTVIILYNMRASPRRNLVLSLKEPQPPFSVQAFAGYDLKDVPFTYSDGRASITLSGFDGGQMVLVRRKPAPADERPEELRQRTMKQLASTDWESLSAGAWFAGWHPEWKSADALISLLNNPHWQVRRSATEALGRLGYMPALPALHSAVTAEKDSNVLGQELLALGRLRDPDISQLALQMLTADDPMVRKMAVRATLASIESALAEGHRRDDAMQIAQLALADPNLRVRREGIGLIFRLSSATALQRTVAAFTDQNVRSIQERPEWSANLAGNDPAFAEYLHQNLPGGDALLLSLATTRVDPALAGAIEKRLVELDSAWPGQVAAAAIEQGSRSLARRMFQERARLRPETAACVPHILEHAFDAQLGGVMEDWDQFLKEHDDASTTKR